MGLTLSTMGAGSQRETERERATRRDAHGTWRIERGGARDQPRRTGVLAWDVQRIRLTTYSLTDSQAHSDHPSEGLATDPEATQAGLGWGDPGKALTHLRLLQPSSTHTDSARHL